MPQTLITSRIVAILHFSDPECTALSGVECYNTMYTILRHTYAVCLYFYDCSYAYVLTVTGKAKGKGKSKVNMKYDYMIIRSNACGI